MKKFSELFILLCVIISCRKNEISYNELFNPKPPNINFAQNSKYQFYEGDTIKSQQKISDDSIVLKFINFDEKSRLKKEIMIQMYYVVPQIYSNIKTVDNNLPYKISYDPINSKGFFSYIRREKNSEFEAYVVNNNKIVFKDYIKDFEKGNNTNMSNKEQLIHFLNSNKIKYKILKDKYAKESGRQYLTLKIISDKDSSINKLTLSKFEFEMKTYYEDDTIPNWNKITYDKFRY